MPRFDVVTFDCYGTLIDWENGISSAFLEAARAAGVSLERDAVLTAYAQIEPQVEEETYRSYREVLRETAVRVAARLGWRLGAEHAAFLADSLPSWRPFPDTNPALRQLAGAGCRLGILSNVDDDLLERTRQLLEVPFDPVVTAAQVRSYKPGPAHFVEARRRLPRDARWLHAAQSFFHDVVPCRRLGISVAWIDRRGQNTGQAPAGTDLAPDARFGNLTGLAEWVASA